MGVYMCIYKILKVVICVQQNCSMCAMCRLGNLYSRTIVSETRFVFRNRGVY